MLNCKNILTSVAAGVLLLSINAAEKKQTHEYHYTHRIKCVSHSGESAYAPGYSRAAYSLAMQRKADVVKLNIRYTKDGIPVIAHDGNMKKAMKWDVFLSQKTLAELKEKTLVPRGGYDSEKILSLQEALEIVKECPEFWYDTKGTFNAKRFKATLAIFEKAGISLDRIMVATWSTRALREVMRDFPQIRRVRHIQLCHSTKKKGTVISNFGFPETGGNQKDIVKLLLKVRDEYKLYGLNLPKKAFQEGLLTADDVKTLRDAGVWCAMWIPRTAEEAKLAAEMGVDAVVTGNLKEVRPFCRIPESDSNKK